jgi:hypothetical protein
MMVLLLNGATGGWDELAIALIALGVLWVAVKLAGRKSSGPGDETDSDELADEEEKDSATPPATPRD